MNSENNLAEALANSKIYRDYEHAFSETTGLPVALRPVESWQLPHHGQRKENRFCAVMAQKSRSCAARLQTQQELHEKATHEPRTVTCQMGLCAIADSLHIFHVYERGASVVAERPFDGSRGFQATEPSPEPQDYRSASVEHQEEAQPANRR